MMMALLPAKQDGSLFDVALHRWKQPIENMFAVQAPSVYQALGLINRLILSAVSDHFLELRVIDEDVHLMELYVRVVHGEWSATSSAYVSRSFLTENGEAILRWVEAPTEPLNIEAGADTGMGWMILQFYRIDRAGHVRCAITLATKTRTDGPRAAETSRFAIELPTELGLIERFARACIALGSDPKLDANLTGLPT
jgi:hypothetical protein